MSSPLRASSDHCVIVGGLCEFRAYAGYLDLPFI